MDSALFSPFALGGLNLANRIVVSPMCQYSATDGNAADWHLMHLGSLAIGGFALVIGEATAVAPEGRITPRCLGLYSDANERNLARVVAFCRQAGGAKLGVQLAHAGRKASCHAPWDGGRPLRPDEGAWPAVAPSAIPYGDRFPVPAALDAAGLARVRDAFVAAARRALRLGFDLIELHVAHGYLLHEFLSPLANRRTDSYGGTLDGRMRFPLEVFAAVRAAWPAGRPLGVRISATDHVPGGWTIDEAVVLAQALRDLGCDFIDVSSGGLSPDQKLTPGPGYQVPYAERIRRETGLPTIAVGMITSPTQAEAIIRGGQADLVALARGALLDPRWPWHAAETLGAGAWYPPQYARCRPDAWREAFSATPRI